MSVVFSSEVRDLVSCAHGSAIAFAGVRRCPHCGAVQAPSGDYWAAPHLVSALAKRYAEEQAPAEPSALKGIRPGARVRLGFVPVPGFALPTPPYARGDLGRVVRLVHFRIEGEPVDNGAPVLVHVRFDGAERAIAFAPECLSLVDDPDGPS